MEAKKERLKPDWPALLNEALEKPGKINEAYSLFHRYSASNSWWLACQLMLRGLEMGPVASFRRWKELGRSVKKGERALWMCMPVTVRAKAPSNASCTVLDMKDERTDEPEPIETPRKVVFVERPNWFAFCQTEPIEGAEQPPADQPESIAFDVAKAMGALGFGMVPFAETDGNTQGFCRPAAGEIAINPMASDAFGTIVHEMAHCILHKDVDVLVDGQSLDRGIREVEAEGTAYLVCATLGHTARLESARAYIQGWLASSAAEFSPRNAQRIFGAASKILRAGEQIGQQEASEGARAAA